MPKYNMAGNEVGNQQHYSDIGVYKSDNGNGQWKLQQFDMSGDRDRARGLGEAAANRAAYQPDMSGADHAIGMMKDAAQGNAPSRAEILGRNMLDQSMQSQLGAAASARGGAIGQAAAMRSAQQGAATFQQQGINQLAGMRAEEMADARSAYMGASMQKAGLLSQNENFQRGLNQQAQMGYESAANETNYRQNQLNAANYNARSGQDLSEWQTQVGADTANADRTAGMIVGGIGAGGQALAAAAASSDERAKTNIVPLSSPTGSNGNTSDQNSEKNKFFGDLQKSFANVSAGASGLGSARFARFANAKFLPENFSFSKTSTTSPTLGQAASSMTTPASEMPDVVASDKRTKTDTESVGARMMENANRSLAPFAYRYKDQFTPEDQSRGDVNVGPMAQNMASNPLSATAVTTMPNGMLAIDYGKAMRLALGGIGSLQEQIDSLKKKEGKK